MSKKIIVVGGGASGLMAAGIAAENGADVLLLEKMSNVARKIRISGKGRCNLTNSTDLADFISHFYGSGKFLYQSFNKFFNQELVSFFESHGVRLQTERGGRVFPVKGDAPAVANTLINWARQAGVVIRTGAAVSAIIKKSGGVNGVVCNAQRIEADTVILATGGGSYPRTGSTGDGYWLAERMGHTLIPIRPALIPVETKQSIVQGPASVDLRNVMIRIYLDGKRKAQLFGEMNLTASTLGGPIILTKSLMMVDALRQDQTVAVHLDLKPALDEPRLDARLQRDFQQRSSESMKSVLRGLIPRELVFSCLSQTGIAAEQQAGQLSAKKRKRLRIWLKDIRFEITGHRPLEEAIVTAGGVRTSEINPVTMESKITPGLYIVGELLDIQGDTGGYNLQAAFSTGWMAGYAAAGQ